MKIRNIKLSIFLVMIATTFIVYAIYIERLSINLDDKYRKVSIILDHPKFPVKVIIPRSYLGPKFLRLSKDNELGGHQPAVLIELYYPSLKPRYSEPNDNKFNEKLIYASIEAANPHTLENLTYVNGYRDRGPYKKSGKKKCGFQEFLPKMENLHRVIYFLNAKNGSTDGVYASCQYRDGAPEHFCRINIETDKGLFVTVNLIPFEDLCLWSDISLKVRSLVNSFVKTER